MNTDIHVIEQLPKKATENAILYLFFSFLSGVLEIGAFTAGLFRFDIRMGLSFALAYQIGCLARNPLRLSLTGAACILSCSLPLLPGHEITWVLLLMTTMVSAGIQSAREWLLPELHPVSLSLKRVVRVSGFTGGIFGGFMIGLDLIACIAITACVTVLPITFRQASKSPWINLNRRYESNEYGWIMLLHQTHYFAYAYVLLAILLTYDIPGHGKTTLLQILKGSGLFSLGWISYISGQWLLKKQLNLSAFQAAIAGHALVAACLLCMTLFWNHQIVLGLAWLLSGFGGGSVYAIKDLAKINACRADIELWEHWGHIVGVSLALSSILVLPSFLYLPFMVAFMAALATIFLLYTTPKNCSVIFVKPLY